MLKECEWGTKNICYTSPKCLCLCYLLFSLDRVSVISYLSYILSLLKLIVLSFTVSSSSTKPWANEAIRMTALAGHSDCFRGGQATQSRPVSAQGLTHMLVERFPPKDLIWKGYVSPGLITA